MCVNLFDILEFRFIISTLKKKSINKLIMIHKSAHGQFDIYGTLTSNVYRSWTYIQIQMIDELERNISHFQVLVIC